MLIRGPLLQLLNEMNQTISKDTFLNIFKKKNIQELNYILPSMQNFPEQTPIRIDRSGKLWHHYSTYLI